MKNAEVREGEEKYIHDEGAAHTEANTVYTLAQKYAKVAAKNRLLISMRGSSVLYTIENVDRPNDPHPSSKYLPERTHLDMAAKDFDEAVKLVIEAGYSVLVNEE